MIFFVELRPQNREVARRLEIEVMPTPKDAVVTFRIEVIDGVHQFRLREETVMLGLVLDVVPNLAKLIGDQVERA